MDYEVAASSTPGYNDYNDNFVVTSLANSQDMYPSGTTTCTALVMLKDPYQAERGAGELTPPSGRITKSPPGARKATPCSPSWWRKT